MAGEDLPWWRTFPWLKLMRWTGGLCGLCIIALGLYQLIVDDPEFKPVVDNVYRIIFGILIVIAELQFVKLLDWFSFLCSLIGLGGFYIFVGGLALGSEWYAITLAVILCVIGILYCMAGATCQDDRPTAVDLKAGGTGQPASSSGPSKSMNSSSAEGAVSSSAPPKRETQPWPNMGDEEQAF